MYIVYMYTYGGIYTGFCAILVYIRGSIYTGFCAILLLYIRGVIGQNYDKTLLKLLWEQRKSSPDYEKVLKFSRGAYRRPKTYKKRINSILSRR